MPGGGLTVGGVVANLGARLDDDAFNRWERRVREARRTAADGVEARLRGDHDETGFRRFDQRLDRARRDARDDVQVALKGDHDETGFRRFTQRLTRARADARDGAAARLRGEHDETGFRRWTTRLERAQAAGAEGATARLDADADTRGFDLFNRAAGDATHVSGRLTASAAGLGAALGASAGAAGVAVIGLGALAYGAKKAVDVYEEHEIVARRQNLVIRTMGQDAGATAEHVNELAASLMRKTGVDDDTIVSSGNIIRTFRNVRNEAGEGADVFDRTLKAALDLSAAFGTDLQAASIQLGKALDDPARGAAALSRTGAIAKADVEALKDAAEAGTPRLELQRRVLAAVERQVRGTAEESATASAKIRASFGELVETIGGHLAPGFNRAVNSVRRFSDGLREGTGAGGRFADRLRAIGSTIGRAWDRVGDAFRSVGRFITRAVDENRDTLNSMGATVSRIARTVGRGLESIRESFASTFGSGSGTSRNLRAIIRTVLDVADAFLRLVEVVVRRTLPPIVNAVRGFATILRGILRVITGVLTGDFDEAWDGVKDIFRGGLRAIGRNLRDATAPLRGAARGIGRAVGGAFSDAWDSIVRTAEGFVNRVIDVINLLPGVNIGKVGRVRGERGGGPEGSGRTTERRRGGPVRQYQDGGLFGATGGYIDAPIVIAGEEAPQHGEMVIPFNPAYRERAVELWEETGRELGVMFRRGGRVAARTLAGVRGAMRSGAAGVAAAFQTGGRFSRDQLEDLWRRVNPGLGSPRLMAAIALAESGGLTLNNYPSTIGRLPDGGRRRAAGLWQILGLPFEGDVYDPETNARMAGAKLRAQGLGAWEAYTSGAYRKFLSGSGGLAGALRGIGDAVSGAVTRVVETAAQVARRLVGQLPKNPGGIIAGAYRYALDKARAYIRDKAKDVLESVGFGGGSRGAGIDGAKPGFGPLLAHFRRLFGNNIYVSSGIRPGDRTTSGRISNHSSGNALDITNPASAGGTQANPPPRTNLDLLHAYIARNIPRPPRRDFLWRTPEGGNHFNHIHLGMDDSVVGSVEAGQRFVARLPESRYQEGGRNQRGRRGRGPVRRGRSRPRPTLTTTENRGITRSVARGERGIGGYERDIQNLERDYSQADRRFGLDDEVILIEHDDGSVTIDEGARRKRAVELAALHRRRETIKRRIQAYRRAIGRLIRALNQAIERLTRALRAARGRRRQKERAGYRDAIRQYRERVEELRGTHSDLTGDVEDSNIDLAELRREQWELARSVGRPADAPEAPEPPDPGDTPDPSDPTSPTDPTGDPDKLTPQQIAAQAFEQYQTIQAQRADLLRDFGSNSVRTGADPYAGAAGIAAGNAYYGAAGPGSAVDSRAFAAPGGSVTYIEEAHFENHYPATPPDGGSYMQQQAREARHAFG